MTLSRHLALIGSRRLTARRAALLGAAVFGVLAVSPAQAQFSDIFRDPPPRPPGDIRPSQAPSQPQNQFPTQQRNAAPRPMDVDRDQPPARPLPAPMSLPPGSRPGSGNASGGGAIQSEPLAPLPGGPITPQPPPGEQPMQQANPPGSLPGLPPGQRQPRGGLQQQQGNTAPQPGDEVVVEPPPQKIANPQAVFAGLDKITGRIIKFDVAINETVQFGALQVTPRACYTRPPTETQNTDAFIDVDEVTLQGETRRIFTGWMYAASPGLHAVEHPIYDVWLTDCKGAQAQTAEAPVEAPKPAPRAQQPRAQSAPPGAANAQQPRAPQPQRAPTLQPPPFR